ncbi:hypothetical protein HYG86_11350 [Alkalicella caledoniensis]|uniref:Uncharacterized protein n=1 Tax=Alkalicella caledoniensis TaxID=2731377 RepID=A0A7G9W9F6_ALKCA|nr:hypothetical protein [Alkalicella caledoniensis]QNO15318.1 hypothetical protein HYG86_11350 [Alkalicella caledoniensis]
MTGNNGKMETKGVDQVFEDMQKDLNDVKALIRSLFNRKIGGVFNG